MLTRNISAWRTASLLLGLLAIWVAMASRVAVLDEKMLTGHMVQHLLLMTIAPPLIWLGAPVARWPRVQKLGRVVGNPAFCWLAATAVLVGWHAPAAFLLAMQSGFWHTVEQVSFLVAGLLFWWPVIQAAPRWSILLYLFLATLPCDVLSGFLVFSDRIVYPVYLCTPRQSTLSVLEDQQCAGALMWTVVTVVYLVAGTIFASRLLSPGRNPAPVEVR
jgi:cytochrome c oxidase assembly factor CtaG